MARGKQGQPSFSTHTPPSPGESWFALGAGRDQGGDSGFSLTLLLCKLGRGCSSKAKASQRVITQVRPAGRAGRAGRLQVSCARAPGGRISIPATTEVPLSPEAFSTKGLVRVV